MVNVFKIIEGDTDTILYNRDNAERKYVAEKKDNIKPKVEKVAIEKAIAFGLSFFTCISTAGNIETFMDL